MKRGMILALIAALAIALVAGTAAATPGKGNSGKGKGPAVVTYEFKGTVTGVTEATPADPVAGTEATPASITVDVTGGNNATKQLHGSQTFSVNGATKIEVDDEEGADLDQIGEGYKVNVQSKAAPGTTSGFVARHISAESPEADDDSGEDEDAA